MTTSAVQVIVLRLRDYLYAEAAERLECALDNDLPDVALTDRERTQILDVLMDPPDDDELTQLRRTLLAEYTWRVGHGLAAAPPA